MQTVITQPNTVELSRHRAVPAADRPPAPADPDRLASLAALLDALNAENIRYCHWKSNVRLPAALRGETDLDLLVDRRHALRFRAILAAHTVKPVLAPHGKRYPGLEDYLGVDPASGSLFHLHVHYRLVLGEQFVKNYHLPLEQRFLNSSRLRYGVKVPAPELELAVLALRGLLKYRDRDLVKDLLTIRHPGIPVEVQAEIAWLTAQVTDAQLAETLAAVGDVVPSAVVPAFLDVMRNSPRDGVRLFALRREVRRGLRRFQRYGRPRARLIYATELWRRRNSFLRYSPVRRMTPAGGGMSLALVGADGAGKSTLSQLVRQWLGEKMDVHLYYLGSKEPSRRSKWLYLAFRTARRSHRELVRLMGDRSAVASGLARVRDNLLRLHHLSIGQDRRRRYRIAKQQEQNGSLVIYDRFPLELIADGADYRLLDGPQIESTLGDTPGRFARWLAQREADLYREMELPACLIVLDVSPAVSAQRKPDHDRAVVRSKIGAIRDLSARPDRLPASVDLICLDADRPLTEVAAELRARIWDVI